MLALEGIRVADFTRVYAGPAATMWLSVLGAEVVKIEDPARPDAVRRASRGPDGRLVYSNDPRTAAFQPLNASKKSCSLDLKSPKGQQIARELIRVSDVVVENFATGVMDRFGLGYEQVRAIKPDIVMLSASGFGRTGPHKDYVAYATIATAFPGLNAVTGYEGGQPQLIGGAWGDLLSAKVSAFLILAGLEQRRRTGRGLYIDLSMTETMATLIPDVLLDAVMNGKNRPSQRPRGNRDSIMAPHNAYPCKGNDQWAVIAVGSDDEWGALCDVIGRPDWKHDTRFADQYDRWLNQQEIDPEIAKWTARHTNREVMEKLQGVGVAAAPSSTVDQLCDDPHLKARDYYVELPDPRLGKVVVSRLPGTTRENSVYGPAPACGEHNGYVLREILGMAVADVQTLEERGIILKV